jgi:MFS transporter, OFA family, oxalate/formate antiporter
MARNPGWKVVFAGTGINLALGILYAWSIFKTAIEKDLGWDPAKLNDPYAICCLVFSFSMILAGRCQDKIGPRWTATLGGILVAIGLALASQSRSYGVWVLGFGVLVGIGMGFGYSSATPPALKWFPASETGKVAGIVVAGFGLAPLYIAPLTETLLKMGGLHLAAAFYAGFFLLVVCGLATCLKNPTTPAGTSSASKVGSGISLSPSAMLKTREFYLLWLVYFIGAGAGLMVISSMNGMAKKSMGDYAFLAVIVLAIGNAAGRVVAGVVSDRIGRKATLLIVTLLQAGCMLLSIPITQQGHYALLIVLLATMIGFNYGANLCLFPAFIKDLCGLTHFGVNYGILFTSWGIGGFVLSRVQQMLKASSGDFRSSFMVAAGLLLFGAAITIFLKGPKKPDLA